MRGWNYSEWPNHQTWHELQNLRIGSSNRGSSNATLELTEAQAVLTRMTRNVTMKQGEEGKY